MVTERTIQPRLREGTDAVCVYCREAAGPAVETCAGCGALGHAECLAELRSRARPCATLGCPGRGATSRGRRGVSSRGRGATLVLELGLAALALAAVTWVAAAGFGLWASLTDLSRSSLTKVELLLDLSRAAERGWHVALPVALVLLLVAAVNEVRASSVGAAEEDRATSPRPEEDWRRSDGV